jgi:cell envelope-related function transcriptional attenuator common domain
MNNSKLRRPHKRKSSAFQVTLLIFFSIMIVTAVFAGGYVLRSILVKPTTGGDENNTLYTGASENNTAQTTENSAPAVSGNKTKGYTRRDNVYNFLLIGRDKAGMNTDVMILASFDCTTGKISMCQMPRDTYAEYNGTYGKLNAAFASFYSQAKHDGSADPTKAGLEGLTNLFQTSLNIRIDYYMMIYLDGFKAVVNRIGGVDMYVPYDMDYEDPYQDLYIHIKQGQQTLMGDDAEGFVRFRSGYIQADIGRADAQKMFISAFIAKVKASVSVPMIAGIAADVLPNLITDMPLNDCIYFAKAALSADLSNITMMTMPGTSYKNGRFYIMERKSMYNIVNTYLNVYTENIPESYFDVDRIFTDDSGSEIDALYTSGDGEVVAYSAEDVTENGIDIGLK